MGIEKFIKTVCVQDAVYWGGPTPDGYGGFTFDYLSPREIKCRWDDMSEVIIADNGDQIVCRAKILVTEDLDELGYLYLGNLSDLSLAEQGDPRTVAGAYQIRRIEKVSMIKSTKEFVRTVFVSNQRS